MGMCVHAVPEPEAISAVYFLVLKGEVVYVGQSMDVIVRVRLHRGVIARAREDAESGRYGGFDFESGTWSDGHRRSRDPKPFDYAVYIPCPPEALTAVETWFIRAIIPRFNTTAHNPTGIRASPPDFLQIPRGRVPVERHFGLLRMAMGCPHLSETWRRSYAREPHSSALIEDTISADVYERG